MLGTDILSWKRLSRRTRKPVHLILFITVSGVYLWYVLRAERKVGLILLFAGALSFFVMAYALSH